MDYGGKILNRGRGDEDGVAVVMETSRRGNSPFFPDRQADTRGLTAECVNMKGVCGYETAAATPIRTRSYLLSSNGMVQLGRTY